MEPKTTTVHNICSTSLLWIRCVAVAFRSEKVFWRRGPPPGDIFGLALDPPRGRYGLNIFMHVPGHEHFIPTKFRKHPLTLSLPHFWQNCFLSATFIITIRIILPYVAQNLPKILIFRLWFSTIFQKCPKSELSKLKYFLELQNI